MLNYCSEQDKEIFERTTEAILGIDPSLIIPDSVFADNVRAYKVPVGQFVVRIGQTILQEPDYFNDRSRTNMLITEPRGADDFIVASFCSDVHQERLQNAFAVIDSKYREHRQGARARLLDILRKKD